MKQPGLSRVQDWLAGRGTTSLNDADDRRRLAPEFEPGGPDARSDQVIGQSVSERDHRFEAHGAGWSGQNLPR